MSRTTCQNVRNLSEYNFNAFRGATRWIDSPPTPNFCWRMGEKFSWLGFLTYLIHLLRIKNLKPVGAPNEGQFKRSLWTTCARGAGRELQGSARGAGERD